jgi:hypothetical protein
MRSRISLDRIEEEKEMPRKSERDREERSETNDSEELDTDINDLDDEEETIDDQVKDLFDQAQELDYGRSDLQGKLRSNTARTPELSGGDIDAGWEYDDVGEEAVGGQNPTPDQNVVDEEGKALGVTYNDDEPLDTEDKIGKRDREPWELNPASSPDYGKRVNDEFKTPIKKLTADARGRGARKDSTRDVTVAPRPGSKTDSRTPAARVQHAATGPNRAGAQHNVKGARPGNKGGAALKNHKKTVVRASRNAAGHRRVRAVKTTRHSNKGS